MNIFFLLQHSRQKGQKALLDQFDHDPLKTLYLAVMRDYPSNENGPAMQGKLVFTLPQTANRIIEGLQRIWSIEHASLRERYSWMKSERSPSRATF
jgi:hypothetical protein